MNAEELKTIKFNSYFIFKNSYHFFSIVRIISLKMPFCIIYVSTLDFRINFRIFASFSLQFIRIIEI